MLYAASCQPSYAVTKQNSTKLCNMLRSEPDLQTHVKNLRRPTLKLRELDLLILDSFQLEKLPDAQT